MSTNTTLWWPYKTPCCGALSWLIARGHICGEIIYWRNIECSVCNDNWTVTGRHVGPIYGWIPGPDVYPEYETLTCWAHP